MVPSQTKYVEVPRRNGSGDTVMLLKLAGIGATILGLFAGLMMATRPTSESKESEQWKYMRESREMVAAFGATLRSVDNQVDKIDRKLDQLLKTEKP